MFKKTYLSAGIAALLCHPLASQAASDADLQAIREQINQLKQSYEQRITQLEQRLQQAEAHAATQSQQTVQPVTAVQSAASSEGAFNPAISLILGGTYSNLTQAPTIPATGFAMTANPGHPQGFNLGESELGISASIDPDYRGVATLALASPLRRRLHSAVALRR